MKLMYEEPMLLIPVITLYDLLDRTAAAEYAANDLASDISQLITTTPRVEYADSFATSATHPSEPSNSPKAQPDEPASTSQKSQTTCTTSNPCPECTSNLVSFLLSMGTPRMTSPSEKNAKDFYGMSLEDWQGFSR